METYKSVEYGAYNRSKFMIDLKRTVAVPGDFYKYILFNVSDVLLQPFLRKMKEDPFLKLLSDEYFQRIPNIEERDLKAMFTTYHETAHLVQDFTLGSEILRDYLGDMISYQEFTFIKLHERYEKRLSFPLKPLDNNALKSKMHALVDLYQDIYEVSLPIDISIEEPVAIGTTDLIEAYAAAKVFYYIIKTEPDAYHGNGLNKSYHNSQLGKEYKNAWLVFEKALAFDKSEYVGGPLSQDRTHDLLSFLLICDISLHIPVPSFDECLQKDYELPEYHLPYMRFYRILLTIIENDGYPDAVEGEDFYITFFDFIARSNGWPTFQETFDGWSRWIAERMSEGFMVSDGYRMICANYKKEYANELIAGPPGSFFLRTGIPALVRYYKRNNSIFEYERIFGMNAVKVLSSRSFDSSFDPYKVMTNPEYSNNWSAVDFISEIHKSGVPWAVRAGITFLREIICRILSKEFYSAVLDKECLCCPLADLRCKKKDDDCHCLKSFEKLPNCYSLAIWLEESGLQPGSFYWR